MGKDDSVETLDYEMSSEEGEDEVSEVSVGKAKQHKQQLSRLSEKDPEFFDFLKEHDQGLLQFDYDDDEDTDIDENAGSDLGDEQVPVKDDEMGDEKKKPVVKTITTDMVESWCKTIRECPKVGPTRSLLRAYRYASHYGDDEGDDSGAKLSNMTSAVFNKIMISVLTEMDGALRKLLKLPASGGKKETMAEIMVTRQWKNYSHMVKSYLGNSLHILNQMTDTDMISFTIRRLKSSTIFLAAFPSLLRRYIKVVLHFWGTGGGALPVVSFLFLRDMCVRLGPDCLDECIKGIYKAYIMNCGHVNATNLPHIQFLGNCIIELLGVDIPAAYQHAFVYIRQLGTILHNTLTLRPNDHGKKSNRSLRNSGGARPEEGSAPALKKSKKKTKDAARKVYEWKFMNCLELWTGAICAYGTEAEFQPLAYPLTQIILGAARLVPSARYFPLRLRCIKMMNRIAVSTGTFIPVSMLLLDMLEMKELNRPPTGGVGKAVDLRTIIKVNKQTIKTRAFQEACVYSVAEELAEHLAQWSYNPAFFELAFIPSVRLRSFCKSTKVDRFRKEMRELVRQLNANSEFVNQKRSSVSFLPSDPAALSFLEDEQKLGSSPLSQYVQKLRQRAQQRSESLMESSVIVGERSSRFGKLSGKNDSDSDEDNDDVNEQGTAAFGSSWLPSKSKHAEKDDGENKKKNQKKDKKTKGKANGREGEEAMDEDVVEDLVLSSDEGGSSSDDDEFLESPPEKTPPKKQKQKYFAKNSSKSHSKKSRKRKRTQ